MKKIYFFSYFGGPGISYIYALQYNFFLIFGYSGALDGP